MIGNFSALWEANLNKPLGCWQLNLKIETWGKVEAACDSIHDCLLYFLFFCFVEHFVRWTIQNCTCFLLTRCWTHFLWSSGSEDISLPFEWNFGYDFFIHAVLVLRCNDEERSSWQLLSFWVTPNSSAGVRNGAESSASHLFVFYPCVLREFFDSFLWEGCVQISASIVFYSENFIQLTGIPSLFFALSVYSLDIFRIEGLNYEIHLWKMNNILQNYDTLSLWLTWTVFFKLNFEALGTNEE